MLNAIIEILKGIFQRKEEWRSDALIDERPQSEKDKSFFDVEFSMGDDEYDWKEEIISDPDAIPDGNYFPHNQATSLSCVTLGIALWIQYFARLAGRLFIPSRKDAYGRRSNYPYGGVAMHDAIKIAREGVASEDQVKSQGLGESAMNARYMVTPEIQKTRSENKIKDAIYVKNFYDIDNLAKASRHSPVMIFVFFDNNNQYGEFWRPFPQVINKSLSLYGGTTARHQITGIMEAKLKVMGGVLINGIKHLKVQDSAGVGTGYGRNKNIRYLSEEFVKYRVYEASYAIPELPPVIVPEKPKFDGTRILKVGMAGNDVRQLQEVLQAEECFEYPNPTGAFYGITRKGVIKLQEKHSDEILKPVGLVHGTGIVGKSTLAWLRKNYG